MDKHLNFFKFFNGSSNEYWEDNLSRAFAICLQNDSLLLSSFLRRILGDEFYSKIFNVEYPNNIIEIDLQRKVNYLEGYSYIYAIACSGIEIDTKKIQEETSRDTGNPETDLFIQIGDICILFEFKRGYENCSAQLKEQAEIVKKNSTDSNPIIKYKDLNWKDMIKICLSVLSLERQIKNENIFLKNFMNFLEEYNTSLFPEKNLSEISFPVERENDKDPNSYYLGKRLNSIKDFISLNIGKTKLVGDRYIISIDEPWAQELDIGYRSINNENYITVDIYPGDTKGQGNNYFKKNKEYNWGKEDILGYKVLPDYYLKFSHFNSGITWLSLTEEESKKTHNYDFFLKYSGRYNNKWKKNWKKEFCKIMDNTIPGWKERTDWNNVIENSNRTYFDLSIGTHLCVLIPYSEAVNLDNNNSNNKLAKKIEKIYEKIIAKIDS